MKTKCKTYIYKNGEFVAEKPSAVEAAQYANVSPMVVKNIVSTNQKVTRKGWTFSYKPLSLDKLEEIKRICAKRELAKEEKIEKARNGCTKELGDSIFEVDCKDGRIFDIPRSDQAKKDAIMALYMADLRYCRYESKIAMMKRAYMKELLNSL